MDKDRNSAAPIVAKDCTDDYFAELCALTSTGTLSPAEWCQFEAHLSHCASCRTLKAEYDKVISTTLPSMAANSVERGDNSSSHGWSLEEAESALFERIGRENIEPEKTPEAPSASSRFHLPLIIVAAAALLLSCSYLAYRTGMDRGKASLVPVHQVQSNLSIIRPEPQEVSSEPHLQGQQVDPKIAARLQELQRRLQESATQTVVLEGQRASLLDQLSQRDTELKEKDVERAGLEQRLFLSENNAQVLQTKLSSATADSSEKKSLAVLQQRVEDLTGALAEKDRQLAGDTELLEHDRDIRNLMGARDLYIGEIYDVAKSGKTQKPFGRVFYTEGKALVFYAYDLDQQPGVKLATTFQAWGRTGIDQQHDVSLGMFYQDDQNKKRWVLKSNDSATLAHLDAVFVTVEPHGESTKPTGKPLLFTYLKLPPNHP